MSRRTRIIARSVFVLGVTAGIVWHESRVVRLSDRGRGEEGVQELGGGERRWLRPSRSLRAEGGSREAIVSPPPTTLRWRVRPPAGAALRFAIGVEGSGKREDDASGVRFVVAVDGRDVFERTVNPGRSRHDRQWFDERVDLAGAADRDVEITLRSEAAGGGTHLAGTAGWADVRLVRELAFPRQPASAERPSVLVLLVDTLRADRLGCYGAQPSPTPTLDRLAASGTVFEQAIAQASWTMPAVATIMTGLHPRDHGLVGWAAGALSNRLPTLPERAAAGWITTFGVSANPLVSARTNFGRGFETFADFAWDEERKNWADAAALHARLFPWLEAVRGHRFLAYVQYMEPHDPYTPPAALRPPPPAGIRPEIAAGRIDAFAQKIGGPTAPLLTDAEVGYLRALYDGEVRAWDAALADVLARLDALGLRESTVVLVMADHGEEFLEHGRLKHGAHLYDESIRIPLVVAGPGIPAARVTEPVQEIDVFPTLARLRGVERPAGLPGVDVLRSHPKRPVFSETNHGLGERGAELQLRSVRHAGWKVIETPALQRREAYDLAADPGEQANLAGDARSAALVDLLAQLVAAAPPTPEVAKPDPALQERLRALGYAQ